MRDKVHLDRHEDGVRVLTLTDPDRRNAIGLEMHAELIAGIAEVVADGAARSGGHRSRVRFLRRRQ